MIIKKDFEIPIYGGYLAVLITDEEGVKIGDHYEEVSEIPGEIEFCHAVHINIQKEKLMRANLAAFKIGYEYGQVSYGVIAHEASHITFMIMEYVGIIHSGTSDEAFSYLIQWVVNKIHEVFDEYGIKVHLNLGKGNSPQ